MSYPEEEMEKKDFLKVEVEGKDKSIWEGAKEKLMNLMSELMDTKINTYSDSTVKDELKRATSNVIEFANAKLIKPSLENMKLQVEIEQMLSSSAKIAAETRKTHAEAESIELANLEKRMKMVMGAARLIAIAEDNTEAILFCNNMEALLGSFGPANMLQEGKTGQDVA